MELFNALYKSSDIKIFQRLLSLSPSPPPPNFNPTFIYIVECLVAKREYLPFGRSATYKKQHATLNIYHLSCIAISQKPTLVSSAKGPSSVSRPLGLLSYFNVHRTAHRKILTTRSRESRILNTPVSRLVIYTCQNVSSKFSAKYVKDIHAECASHFDWKIMTESRGKN